MSQPPITDRLSFLEDRVAELQEVCRRLSRAQSYPQFLDVDGVCEMFGVKRVTVDGWVSAGIVPYRKAGGKTVFMLSELIDWTKPKTKLAKVG